MRSSSVQVVLAAATDHRVDLLEQFPTGTRPHCSAVLARLLATRASVRVPPGILQAGRTCYALVRAQHTPGLSLERPCYTAWGSSHADALTHVLAP